MQKRILKLKKVFQKSIKINKIKTLDRKNRGSLLSQVILKESKPNKLLLSLVICIWICTFVWIVYLIMTP